jgi:hypothetical protein
MKKSILFLFSLSLFFSVNNSLAEPKLKIIKSHWGDKFSTKSFLAPKSEKELVKIVSTNYSKSIKYRIVGARHSDNRSIHSKEMMISLNSIPSKIKYDPTQKTVTSSSWLNLLQINEHLIKYGRVLQGTPSVGYQSLGGSLATGSHSEGKNPLISDSVMSIKMLLPNGTIKTFSKKSDLKFFNVSAGMLGVILEVKLRTIPLSRYKISTKYSTLSKLELNQIINLNRSSDRVLIDFYPYHDFIKLSTWNRSIEAISQTNKKERLPSIFDKIIFNLAIKTYQYSKDLNIDLFDKVLSYELERRNETQFNETSDYSSKILLNNFPYPSYGEDLLMKTLLSIPENTKDFEIAVPLNKAISAIKFLSKKLKEARIEMNVYNPMPILLRVGSKSSKSLLGMNANQDVGFIIIPILKNHEEVYSNMIREIINEYEGRPHIGKYLFDLKHEEIFKNYPRDDIKSFFDYREITDKKNLLINDYGKRLIP